MTTALLQTSWCGPHSTLSEPWNRQIAIDREAISFEQPRSGILAFGRAVLKPLVEYVKESVVKSSESLSPPLARRVAELAALQANWDGEGAEAVKPHVLADSVDFIKQLNHKSAGFQEPFLAPLYTGFIQLEWHSAKRSLELEATDGDWAAVGTEIAVTGERQYFTADCKRNNVERLKTFYDWVAGDELVWPSL